MAIFSSRRVGLCFEFISSVRAGEGRKTVLLKSTECSSEVLNFLANKACQCYVALCDWPSVQEWQASVQALKKNSSPTGVHLKMDFNYIQALSHFEDGDFEQCGAQLELLPGEDCSLLSATGAKDKLGNYPPVSPPLDTALTLLGFTWVGFELEGSGQDCQASPPPDL